MPELFTQKWAIVSLLEDIAEGSEFHYTEFPLHITLAGVFAVEKIEEDLVAELSNLLKDTHPISVEASRKDMFGPDKNIAVMRIAPTPDLANLHNLIHSWLVSCDAIFNSPQYQGVGYLPHSTFQKSGKLIAGEKRVFTSISLVDLYPHNDGYKRKITKTIPLQ